MSRIRVINHKKENILCLKNFLGTCFSENSREALNNKGNLRKICRGAYAHPMYFGGPYKF